MHVLNIGTAELVDRGDAARAISDVGPFGCLMPMQLADAPACEPHVNPSDFLGDLEVELRDLACPAAVLDAPRRVVE